MEFLRHIRVRLAGAMVLIAFIVFAFIASLPAPPPVQAQYSNVLPGVATSKTCAQAISQPYAHELCFSWTDNILRVWDVASATWAPMTSTPPTPSVTATATATATKTPTATATST